jgi:dTDP-4-dehydrorhamnose reductase
MLTMLRLMNEREEVRVVRDQQGCPTWTKDLANTAADLIQLAEGGKPPDYGIYHYANEGLISWFDFAQEIYAQGKALGLISKDCVVKPCSTAEYPTRAVRPAYSALDTGKIRRALGISIPRWDISLRRCLELCGD